MTIIESGQNSGPPKNWQQLADWATWVTMLLSLKRAGPWPVDDARDRLVGRFKSPSQGGLPKGTRVYVARPADQSTGTGEWASVAVSLRNDPRVVLDSHGVVTGFASGGPLGAAKAIQVGEIMVLVLGPTYPSGPHHARRLDQVTDSAGLTRIHPPGTEPVSLVAARAPLAKLDRLFVAELGSATQPDLLPRALRLLWGQHETAG